LFSLQALRPNSFSFLQLASLNKCPALGVMGDMIDKNTGGITFQHSDIELSGNSKLEVAVRRKRTQGFIRHTPFQHGFGDWVLDIPIAHIAYAPNEGSSGTLDEPVFDGGCLTNLGPMQRSARVGNISGSTELDPDTHVTGSVLYIPGRGLSGHPGSMTRLSDPQSDWTSAERSTDHAGRCSTVVISPSGEKYKFGRHVFRNAGSMNIPYDYQGFCHPDFGCRTTSTVFYLPRKYAVYLITEVEDVNGNWVRYDYSNDSRAELKRIYSNDGRDITISYGSSSPDIAVRNSRHITSVSTNGRSWSYHYNTGNVKFLQKVFLPDGRHWRFGKETANNRGLDVMNLYPHTYYRCIPHDKSFEMQHPDGSIGTFRLRETRHIKGATSLGSAFGDDNITHWMVAQNIPHVKTNQYCNGTYDINTNVNGELPWERPDGWPIYQAISVVEKTISNDVGNNATWTFDYRNYSGGSLDNSWTKITDPSGTERTYTHKAIGNDHGLLKSIIVNPIKGSNETITYEHSQTGGGIAGGVYSACRADNPYANVIAGHCAVFAKRPVTKITTKRDGDVFTSEYIYDFANSSKPVSIKKYSNISTQPRITNMNYIHKKSNWVLNLTDSVSKNGRLVSEYTYNSLGQKTSEERYGRPYATYMYHGRALYKGALFQITDAIGRVTELRDWKRGIPERVRRAANTADETNTYQYVDNNGWVTGTKDAVGHTTNYTRDIMGRLTEIDPHGNWDKTFIAYDFTGGGAVQTITKGQSKEIITYDSMFRPISEHTQATDTGWSSYVNTRYDALGRVIFKSQPSLYSTENKGVEMTYDGLGRILTMAENVSPFATTMHSYHSGHRHRITDPSGAWKDYYSYGYDGPNNSDYRQINENNLRTTDINKNIYGQTTSVTQYGSLGGVAVNATQYFYYNDQQRLCRYRGLEGGDTVYDYNPAGEMTAYQKGLSAGSICSNPSDAAKVSLVYDYLGRLKVTDFTDSATPDIRREYFANGNLKQLNRGSGSSAVNWSYTYNDADLLKTENMQTDGRSFSLAYSYNSSGNMTSRTNPNGFKVDYTPDGLGRATTAKYGSKNYASAARYHASGAMRDFKYGNNFNFTQTLNNRLLPSRLLSNNGSSKALDLNYSYDARAKVTSQIDGADIGNNRNFAYDALGQLTSATGPWGGMNVNYDSLGNVLSRNLGPRAINLSYNNLHRLTSYTDSEGLDKDISYDTRGNITAMKGKGAATVCEQTKSQTVKFGTTWVHTATVDTCANKVLFINTTAQNSNQAPTNAFYNFSTINAGQSQTVTRRTFVNAFNIYYTIELRAKFGTDNRLTFEHRAKADTSSSWTPWKQHGSTLFNKTTPLGESGPFVQNCQQKKSFNFQKRSGATYWRHEATANICTGKVLAVYSTAQSKNLDPEIDPYVLSHIRRGSSQTTSKRVYHTAGNVYFTVEERVIFDARRRLKFYHRAKRDGGSWSGWLYHGSMQFDGTPAPVTISNDLNFVYDYSDQPVSLSGKASGTYRYDANLKRVKAVVDGETIYNVYNMAVMGRFLSIDPVTFMDTGEPSQFNRYMYSDNDPINRFDPDGRDSCGLRGCSDQMNIRTGKIRPTDTNSVGSKAVAVMAGAGLAVIAAPAVSAAAAACTGACPAIAVGAGAGAGFEGVNQAQSGEFNPVKLGAAAAVGAAGGAGSLAGKTIAGQMAGAAASAGLAGSTVEMLNQAANGTVDGLGVATAGAKAGAGAALGAGAGNVVGRGLTGASGFGGAGNLSNGGAALGAALGEAASGTTVEILDDERGR